MARVLWESSSPALWMMAPPGYWQSSGVEGKAIVQNPQHALFASMPHSALAHVEVDYVVQLSDMGPLLARLAHEQAAEQESFFVT
jgi:hypothetical protein